MKHFVQQGLYLTRKLSSNTSPIHIHKTVQRSPIRCVIFDMDGTLTVPCLDFQRMRRETGILTGDLLDTIYKTDDLEEQSRLLQIIDDIEAEGNVKLEFQPNMELLLQRLHDSHHVEHVAIVTRNSQSSLEFFLDKISHQPYAKCFTINLSRDFRPYKPNPDPLLHIANYVNVPTENCIMVGDSIDDMKSSKAANCQSCLFTQNDHWTEKHTECVSSLHPDYVVHDLLDVHSIVELSHSE